MNKDGEKEGKRSKGQRKDSKLTKVNNPRVNEKGGKADDISNKFPNFSVLTEEERLVFFEALTAARKNVESRGVPTRDRFGTVHDQYLEYFNREKKDEVTEGSSESKISVVGDGSIRRDSSILDSGEPTNAPSETPSSPSLLPEGDSKNSLPQMLEPLLVKQCESVIEEDTAKMVDMYLDKKKRNEQNRGRKAAKQQKALAFPVLEKPLRETPRFDALNAEEKEIFFKVLQEARNNVVVRNKERMDEILPLDAIVRRYRQADVYASLQEPQKPAEEKNLKVKVTLTSGDNERMENAKQQCLADREKPDKKEQGQDVHLQKRTKSEKPKTPPVGKKWNEVKEELSCEFEELDKGKPLEAKPEKVRDGKIHRTDTKDSWKVKKEPDEVKERLSRECIEEKPGEAKPEKVTDGKMPRTDTKDSWKGKKESEEVKDKLSRECIEEKPQEAKPEKVRDGKIQRTDTKDSWKGKKEPEEVKDKLSRECIEEKPQEGKAEKVTDGKVPRTETKDSWKVKKEPDEVKERLSRECIEQKPGEAKPEKVTDGKIQRTDTKDSWKVKKEPDEVKEKLSRELVEEKPREEKPEKLRDGKIQRTDTKDSWKGKKESEEVKDKLSRECIEEKPQEAKPEKVRDGKIQRTDTRDSWKGKKEPEEVKDKLSRECIEEKDRETKPEKVTGDKINRTDTKDSWKGKKEPDEVKEKISRECVQEKPREAKPEKVTDEKTHRTERSESSKAKKEPNEVKEKLSRECVEQKPREGKPEKAPDGKIHRTDTSESCKVKKEPSEVKEQLSRECEERVEEKAEKVKDGKIHRTDTTECCCKVKREPSEVKEKLSCRCEKPREEKPEKLTDEKTNRTERNESCKEKKKPAEVKEKLSCGCFEEKPREGKPEKVTDGKIRRTDTSECCCKVKREPSEVKEKLSCRCEKPREEKPEKISDEKTHRKEMSESCKVKKEPREVKEKLSCGCVVETPREAKAEKVTDGKTHCVSKSKKSQPDVGKLSKDAKCKCKPKSKLAKKLKTGRGKRKEEEIDPCEAESPKECSAENLDDEILSEKERKEIREVESRLLERQPREIAPEEHGTPKTEKKKGTGKETPTTQVSWVETPRDNAEEVEYRSKLHEVMTDDDPTCEEWTEPSEGSAESVPEYKERTGEVKRVEFRSGPPEETTRDVPTCAEEAEEEQEDEEDEEDEPEDEGITVHGVTGGENLVGSSWEDEGSKTLQAKVMIVDDNVIDKIRKLIYYLEAKTKKDDRLEREYIRLLVDYVAYLSKVMETLVRRKESRQQVQTYAAGEIHLKFDDKGPQVPTLEERKHVGRSVSVQDLGSGSVLVTGETPVRRKESGSETMALISSESDLSIGEGEIHYVPPHQRKRKMVATKVRVLQDLLRHRAEFAEGSTGEFKIVHRPDPEFIPAEKPPTVKLIKEEDEEDSQDTGNILRMLIKCFTCGKKKEEEEGIYQNLRGEAVRVDVSEGKRKDAANATLNQATMEVLKAAGRKRIIEKYYGEN